jgi:hypothetical protein
VRKTYAYLLLIVNAVCFLTLDSYSAHLGNPVWYVMLAIFGQAMITIVVWALIYASSMRD